MMWKFSLMVLIIGLISFIGKDRDINQEDKFQIEWIDSLVGDFSFAEQWEYPEGVYKNRYGQLSCDGICPIEIDEMKDDSSKIIPDSLAEFYALVDTTHLNFSFKSQTSAYEFSDTNLIKGQKKQNGKLTLASATNVSTHSSLIIEIQDNSFNSWIKLNSIIDRQVPDAYLKTGSLKIDKTMWKKGILKAEFDFKFHNSFNPKKELFWNGKILKKI